MATYKENRMTLDRNEYTKGFAELFSVQTEFVKQATEANKKLFIEVLKGTKTVVDAYAKVVEESIQRLNGDGGSVI